jgi:outer membrane protein assembly factor BamB
LIVGLTVVAGWAGCQKQEDEDFVGDSLNTSDWPMYGHDVSRTGYNPGEMTIGLANVDRLTPRFRATVGMGTLPASSGPIVANGRLYVGSSVPDGNNYFCFDAASGAVLWAANVGHSPPFGGNVGIGSTGAVAGTTLVVGGGDPAYYALDAATGAILWRHDIQVDPESFAWSSPLVGNDVVYVGASSRYRAVRSELRSLDLATGTPRAQRFFVPEGRQGADIWNSPALAFDGGIVAVATGNDFGGFDGPFTRAVVTMTPQTLDVLGVRQEALPDEDLDFGTTPIFFTDGQGRALLGAHQKNGVFFAYDANRVADGPVWQRATGLSVGTLPAYDPNTGPGGTLYVVGDNGLVFALDPATGADRWPPVAAGFTNGNLAAANGLVFLASGGNGVVLDAGTGALLRYLAVESPGRSFSGIVVARGMVYWMSGPYLNAWGLGDTPTAPPVSSERPPTAIAVSVSGSPTVAGASTPYRARWTLRIQEVTGATGSVNFVNATLRDAVSGARSEPAGGQSLTAADIQARAGTNRLGPGGVLTLAQTMDYRFLSGRKNAVVTVAVQFADDLGRVSTATGRAELR